MLKSENINMDDDEYIYNLNGLQCHFMKTKSFLNR